MPITATHTYQPSPSDTNALTNPTHPRTSAEMRCHLGNKPNAHQLHPQARLPGPPARAAAHQPEGADPRQSRPTAQLPTANPRTLRR